MTLQRLALTWFALTMGASLVPAATITGFTGSLDSGQWTLNAPSNGSVNTSAAPDSVTVIGSDGVSSGDVTSWTATVPFAGIVSFTWQYTTFDQDGPGFDIAGYLLNGVLTRLSDPTGERTQSGTASFSVAAGDTMGWYVDSGDGCCGAAQIAISNLSLAGTAPDVPEPATFFIVGSGLCAVTILSRRRKARSSSLR